MYANKLVTTRRAYGNKNTSHSQLCSGSSGGDSPTGGPPILWRLTPFKGVLRELRRLTSL
eukprot:1161780-Pelagomonas_calceolata.AAC.8